MKTGWIKLHRRLLNWEWYSHLPTRVLFIHLLLTVNTEDKQWKGITVKRGQRVVSIRRLAHECGLSVQHTRTALANTQLTQELTIDPHSSFTLLTLKNYNQYQTINTGSTQESTNDQHKSQQQLKKKEEKKEEERTLLDDCGTPAEFGTKESIFYGTFKAQCTKRSLTCDLSANKYLDLKAEYEIKLMWWPEVQKCLAWLSDHNKKTVNASRLRNWMNKSLEISKDKEIRARQEFQDKKYAPITKPVSPSPIPAWTPPS